MISCKSVAKLLMSGELESQRWWKRAEVRLHLAMCKYCSRLARQISQLGAAARRLRDASQDEDPELEERLIRRLSGRM
jgi:hypothetical protein